jgi:hypothetical protein
MASGRAGFINRIRRGTVQVRGYFRKDETYVRRTHAERREEENEK